eukprot:330483_1
MEEQVYGKYNTSSNNDTNFTTHKAANTSTNAAPNENTYRSTNEPTNRSTNENTNRSTNETTNETPTDQPTKRPTKRRTKRPTKSPTQYPTKRPTVEPTKQPTLKPTKQPSVKPSRSPTKQPSNEPTKKPTKQPTPRRTKRPTTQRPTSPPTNQSATIQNDSRPIRCLSNQNSSSARIALSDSPPLITIAICHIPTTYTGVPNRLLKQNEGLVIVPKLNDMIRKQNSAYGWAKVKSYHDASFPILMQLLQFIEIVPTTSPDFELNIWLMNSIKELKAFDREMSRNINAALLRMFPTQHKRQSNVLQRIRVGLTTKSNFAIDVYWGLHEDQVDVLLAFFNVATSYLYNLWFHECERMLRFISNAHAKHYVQDLKLRFERLMGDIEIGAKLILSPSLGVGRQHTRQYMQMAKEMEGNVNRLVGTKRALSITKSIYEWKKEQRLQEYNQIRVCLVEPCNYELLPMLVSYIIESDNEYRLERQEEIIEYDSNRVASVNTNYNDYKFPREWFWFALVMFVILFIYNNVK